MMCPNIFYKHLTIIYLFIYFNITFIIFPSFFSFTLKVFSLISLNWLGCPWTSGCSFWNSSFFLSSSCWKFWNSSWYLSFSSLGISDSGGGFNGNEKKTKKKNPQPNSTEPVTHTQHARTHTRARTHARTFTHARAADGWSYRLLARLRESEHQEGQNIVVV